MNLPTQLFVTGTDTGVGKTLVSALLTIGLKAHYWKPIQSGTVDGTDSEWIKSVSNLTPDHFIPEIYKLRAPLSPHAAAQLDDVEIELERVELPRVSTPLIVEGAGGIMVPLNKSQFMIDLIQRLSLPTIVVARSGLGTINHTVLTLDKLRTRNIEVFGVVMNGPVNPSNREALEYYGQTKILAEIPPLDSLTNKSLQAVFEDNLKQCFGRSSFPMDLSARATNGVAPTIQHPQSQTSFESAPAGTNHNLQRGEKVYREERRLPQWTTTSREGRQFLERTTASREARQFLPGSAGFQPASPPGATVTKRSGKTDSIGDIDP